MENEHVIAGLIRKRAELAGRINGVQTALRQLMIDLDNVDATLRIFQPDIDLDDIRPKPLPPRHTSLHGEMGRLILGELRKSALALTAHDLTLRVMGERSMNLSDRGLVRTVQKRVGAALRHLRGRGVIQSASGRLGLVWSLRC